MTSETSTSNSVRRVRNVSENELVDYAVTTPKVLILQIVELLEGKINYKDKKDLYGDIAERLSTIAKKFPAWQWRYVQSVASGTIEPSKRFVKAVEIMSASLDDLPVITAKAKHVTVFADPDLVQSGAYVMGTS